MLSKARPRAHHPFAHDLPNPPPPPHPRRLHPPRRPRPPHPRAHPPRLQLRPPRPVHHRLGRLHRARRRPRPPRPARRRTWSLRSTAARTTTGSSGAESRSFTTSTIRLSTRFVRFRRETPAVRSTWARRRRSSSDGSFKALPRRRLARRVTERRHVCAGPGGPLQARSRRCTRVLLRSEDR